MALFKFCCHVICGVNISDFYRSLEDDDEPIYGNMNFKWQGKNAGDRWENYWKTKTIMRGIDPPKNH